MSLALNLAGFMLVASLVVAGVSLGLSSRPRIVGAFWSSPSRTDSTSSRATAWTGWWIALVDLRGTGSTYLAADAGAPALARASLGGLPGGNVCLDVGPRRPDRQDAVSGMRQPTASGLAGSPPFCWPPPFSGSPWPPELRRPSVSRPDVGGNAGEPESPIQPQTIWAIGVPMIAARAEREAVDPLAEQVEPGVDSEEMLIVAVETPLHELEPAIHLLAPLIHLLEPADHVTA